MIFDVILPILDYAKQSDHQCTAQVLLISNFYDIQISNVKSR